MHAREDVRRLGINISSGGLLSAFLEAGDLLVALGLMLAGIVAPVLGNLKDNP